MSSSTGRSRAVLRWIGCRARDTAIVLAVLYAAFFLLSREAQSQTRTQAIQIVYKVTGSGSVVKTVADFLGANVIAQFFGAAGTGSGDDTAAINNCMAATTKCNLPPGTYPLSINTLSIPNGTHLWGAGKEATTISITGGGDAVRVSNASNAGLHDLTVNIGSNAAAVGIHVIESGSSANLRSMLSGVRILSAAGAPVAGQIGLYGDRQGSGSGPWFFHATDLWVQGVDRAIVLNANVNQWVFDNVTCEQFGTGTNGYCFDIAGNNNLVSNATFSRGGSSVTNAFGFFLNGGTYNILQGSADLSTGSCWTGTIGTTNQVLCTDSSATPLTGAFLQQIRMGATPATVGDIRLSNNMSITARNAANSADITALYVDTNNRCKVGSNAAFVRLDNQIIEFGTGTVASAGVIRVAHATDLQGRNGANSGNRNVLSWGVAGTDMVQVGDASASAVTIVSTAATARAGLRNAVTRIVTRNSSVAAVDCAGAGIAATVTQLVDGTFFTCATAQTLTMPTAQGASGIVQGLPGAPAIGDVFEFQVVSTAAANFTLAAGTGITLVGNAVVNNSSRIVRCRLTAVTGGSETATCYL